MHPQPRWYPRTAALALAIAALAAACGGHDESPPAPGCVPSAEVCNGRDDDCDGVVDDGDPGVGASCSTGLQGVCAAGVLHCQSGSLQCVQTTAGGIEICNGLDDNCDGQVDEGFNLSTDPENCGACGNVCSLPNAVTGCSAGHCVIASCNPGFVDLDGIPANGCEYHSP